MGNNFFDVIAEIFISSMWGLYMIITSFFSWLGSLFANIHSPLLPSATRVLQERYISGGFAIIILAFLIYVNISAFKLFRTDKILAIRNSEIEDEEEQYERISEFKLLMKCFIGGALGGFLGMRIYRHKTLKPKFTIGVSVMLIVQLLLFSIFAGFFGFWLYIY